MVNPEVREALLARLDSLPVEMQRRVLDFAEALAIGSPDSGDLDALLALSGSLDEESAVEMLNAISEGCENVDSDGW